MEDYTRNTSGNVVAGAAMTLSELVTDLATSQRLRDAGFPQDTAMVWVEDPTDNQCAIVVLKRSVDYSICAAPTAEEIKKELPWSIQPWLPNITNMFLLSSKEPDGFVVSWRTSDNRQGVPCDGNYYEKESESAAHAYLWWKKEVAG